MGTPTVLDRRALNRALLARQQLLGRAPRSSLEMVQWLVGLQAQEPVAPYIGLWARLVDFDPRELSELIAERRAVRIGAMRGTIHLLSAPDCATLRPLTSPVLRRAFASTEFARQLGGADLDALVAAGTELLATPRSARELGDALAPRWPQADPLSLANAVRMLSPLVQVPPRGLWGRGGQARWITARAWLGRELDPAPSAADMVLRYLGAFGPASVRDIQAWSGLTGMRAVCDELADRLRVFADEAGNELLDVLDGPLPDPDTPAPVRLLAPFDNAILAHHDRARIIAPQHRMALSRDRLMRTFLVDGFVAGTWRMERTGVAVTQFGALSGRELGAVEREAARLMAFLATRS
ncbi:MAG: AlkZ family DNA glycosylase [Solirubrobacterales bacterium]|nr:AlkZ family DNA glycosylase [Solirubrobacterales bacterium]